MSKISELGKMAGEHKGLATLAGLVVFCAICVGGWFGWQQYQYLQSPAHALEKIKDALNPPDPAELAKLVDFRAVSMDFSRAIQREFPFYMAGGDQERKIRHDLQTSLLQRLMDGDEKKLQTLQQEDEEAQLKKDLRILPPDFLAQLQSGLNLRESGPNSALVTLRLSNPLLRQPFMLAFNMDRTADGWKITSAANAPEVVGQIRQAMLDRHVRVKQMYRDKNGSTRKSMNQLLPVQSCTAHAGLLSDGRTMLMVVHVIARNRGDVQVNNFDLDASILNSSGKPVLRRYLNVAMPVGPGEDFNHRWNFEMDGNSGIARELLHGQPLQCQAAWQTLGLNNGKVLHMVEVPFTDRQCSIAGHNHPDGFCELPVFRR